MRGLDTKKKISKHLYKELEPRKLVDFPFKVIWISRAPYGDLYLGGNLAQNFDVG